MRTFTRGNASFSLEFANTGNVHLKPKGVIQIYNLFGKMVASVQVNPNAQIILPSTNRAFISTWRAPLALGFYRAETHIYYGENKYEATSQAIFWMFPIKTVAIALLIFALLYFLLRTAVRAYNKNLLVKAGLEKPKKSPKNKG